MDRGDVLADIYTLIHSAEEKLAVLVGEEQPVTPDHIVLPTRPDYQDFVVMPVDLVRWKKKYPGLDIESHARNAARYYDANKSRRPANGSLAMDKWLGREWERHGLAKAGRQASVYDRAEGE
jgi:hypothetical protein